MNTKNDISEREDIEQMLPWFAAGTLNRRDTARVEDALAKDAELSRRFELVREELGETIILNESLGAPSARAMKQLFEKIDAEPVRKVAPSVSLSSRISQFVSSFSPRTLAYAGAVGALAIMLQAGVITGLMTERTGGDGSFRTVSMETASAPAANAGGVHALIQFSPNVNAADITKFLEANQATIVGGPVNGMYRVQVAAASPAADIAKKLQDNKVVTFAVPAK